MSLLPSLFRQTDIPMQLGAKVERPAPKKPDPIKEFETGDHTHEGVMLPLEYAQSLRDEWRRKNPEFATAFTFSRGTQEALKALDQFRAEMLNVCGVPTKPPVQFCKGTLTEAAARTELMQDFKSLHDTYIRLGIDFNPFEIRRTAGVPIDSRPTNAQLGKMIDVMISALETHNREPQASSFTVRAPSWADEPPQSPAQEAKAKKMAEIQKAKQELRSMVKRPFCG